MLLPRASRGGCGGPLLLVDAEASVTTTPGRARSGENFRCIAHRPRPIGPVTTFVRDHDPGEGTVCGYFRRLQLELELEYCKSTTTLSWARSCENFRLFTAWLVATRAEAEVAEARQVEAETAQAELAVLRAVRAEVLSERQAEREEYQEESKELRHLNSEESKQLRYASSELAELQTALEASELQPFQLEQERDQWADRCSAVSDELHMQRIMCRRLEHDGSNLREEYLEESAAHRALELQGGELARLHQNEVQEVQQLRQELQQLKAREEAQCQELRQAQHDLIEVRCEHRSVESQLEHQTQRLLERPDQAPASPLNDAQQLESQAEPAEPEPQRQRWLAQTQLEQPDQRPLESSSPDQLGPHVDLQRLLMQTHVLQGPEALPLASSLHDPASPGEFLRELRAVIGASSRLAGGAGAGAGAGGVDYAVKAASEALRRAEARCEISRLRSQAMEADLAALVETRTGSARTQPAAGPELELEEDSPRRKLWEQEEEDEDASDASEGTLGEDLVQTIQIRQLSHLALAGLQLLMRAAFVGWRDQQQLSDVRCKENLLKAWSSHGGRHLSSRLALLCCRTLFGIWRQLVVVSRGRLHHLSLGQAPGFVHCSFSSARASGSGCLGLCCLCGLVCGDGLQKPGPSHEISWSANGFHAPAGFIQTSDICNTQYACIQCCLMKL
eukprot:s2009_g4.t2